MKTSDISQLNTKEMETLLAKQAKEMAKQAEELAVLKNQLSWFQRQLFGRKSEKQLQIDPQQASLFEKKPEPSVDQDTGITIPSHKRRNKTQRSGDEVNDTGLRFDESVPRKIIELSAPELEGEEADNYEVIDYKETTRLAQRPGSYVVLVYRRPVVRHKKEHTLSNIPAPVNVLEGCYADVSLLAGLMVDKAVYHLPLYRQHQRLLDSGIQLSRTTLINYIQKAIGLLEPIYQAQHDHILQSKVLAMDEVPMKAGRKSKGKMQQTYFWPIYGEEDEVAFTWSKSRGTQFAVDQLKGFSGTLLSDGYTAYTKAVKQLNEHDEKVTHATCWAHTRRYFEQALDIEPQLAQHALGLIAHLYQYEKHIRNAQLPSDKALEYRQKNSEPIVTQFFEWVYQERQNPEYLPSNKLLKALNYAGERCDELKVFLSNPHLQIDTNHLERALRVIPMGRKNFLFCWTELGAEQLGVLQSLMVTCRLHSINPYHYLVDVLQRVAIHPATDVAELTPLQWKKKFADNFLTSDVAEMG